MHPYLHFLRIRLESIAHQLSATLKFLYSYVHAFFADRIVRLSAEKPSYQIDLTSIRQYLAGVLFGRGLLHS